LPSTFRHLSYHDASFYSPSSKNCAAMLCSQYLLLFWYPPCTELMVNQSVRDNSSSPRSLWKSFRKFWWCEMTFSMHALVDFLNEFISHNWVSSLTTFIMHISAPIPEFSAPFSHTAVTHNIITIYDTIDNESRPHFVLMREENESQQVPHSWRERRWWCPCFISNYSYTTQQKCMRVGIQQWQTLLVTIETALWRYDIAFLFTNQLDADFGIAHIFQPA
jgi:hypothetical protein